MPRFLTYRPRDWKGLAAIVRQRADAVPVISLAKTDAAAVPAPRERERNVAAMGCVFSK
jgi:hypothetical protein